MKRSWWVSACLVVVMATTGCATEDEEEKVESTASTADQLQSSPLDREEMKPIDTPRGMPTPWPQPDSSGIFDTKGKCGPTAVANTLKLYGIDDVSPEEADRDGVHWWIGTRPRDIEHYMDKKQARLDCSIENPKDGRTFLHEQIEDGHPVMVLFNTTGWKSHWIAAVGFQGSGASEETIVMSWGRYYAISTTKLVASWRNVYGMRSPSIVCEARTAKVVLP